MGIQHTGIYSSSILIFWPLISIFKVCEQLNAWLGGYQLILKCMTPGNFNWFLHTMLFYHTKYVLKKQEVKKKKEENAEELKQRQEDDAEEEEYLGLDEEIVDDDELDE